MPETQPVGSISHYYTKIGVAIFELTDTLAKGDRILIKGITTNFEQTIESMQIEHKDVDKAGRGDSVGVKVENVVRSGDKVYKVVEQTV